MQISGRAGIIVTAILSLTILVGCSGNSDDGESQSLRIGLFSQVDVPATRSAMEAFRKTFSAAEGVKGKEIEWVEKNANGDPQKCQTIARELSSQNLDAVAIMGTPCVVAMASVDKKTPILAVAIADPVGAKLAASLDAPGGNVSGSVRGDDATPFLADVLKVQPAPKSLGIVYDQSNPAVTPWVNSLEQATAAQGMKLEAKGVTAASEVAAAIRTIVSQVDAIVVAPDGMLAGAMPVVGSTAHRQKVPVFTTGIANTGNTGVVAEIGPSFEDMGAIAAEIAIEVVVQGKDISAEPFRKPERLFWTVSRSAAKDTGVTIPQDIMDSAEFVD